MYIFDIKAKLHPILSHSTSGSSPKNVPQKAVVFFTKVKNLSLPLVFISEMTKLFVQFSLVQMLSVENFSANN